jgi:Lsr2
MKIIYCGRQGAPNRYRQRSSWGPGMVRREVVIVEDDLDGSSADETVRFGLDGAEYEIDLSGKNARKFRKRLAPFVEHAHRVAAGQRRLARTAASRQRSRDIRAWAKQQGIELSDRGRMPASIVDQYEASTTRGSRRLAPATGRSAGARVAALSRFGCCGAGLRQRVQFGEPAYRFGARPALQLLQAAVHVHLDRARADEHGAAHLPAGVSLSPRRSCPSASSRNSMTASAYSEHISPHRASRSRTTSRASSGSLGGQCSSTVRRARAASR